MVTFSQCQHLCPLKDRKKGCPCVLQYGMIEICVVLADGGERVVFRGRGVVAVIKMTSRDGAEDNPLLGKVIY